ncbi:MAG: hypothetical protein ACJAW3_001305 [Lentimonas sp.]
MVVSPDTNLSEKYKAKPILQTTLTNISNEFKSKFLIRKKLVLLEKINKIPNFQWHMFVKNKIK